jgi:DNA mismatch endonuclease (patch repair protein)
MGRAVQARRLKGYPFPSSAAVSAAMRANRKRDTGPELKLRSLLHRHGLRFRVNHELVVPGLRVRPDIVFVSRRVAVFVDGCFWHSCRWHGTRPRVNTHYWLPKFARVKARDRKVRALLTRAGWTVLRLWEHAPSERSVDLIRRATVVR